MDPNKTKALVVSRSRTVNPPYGDLILSGVSICASPNLDILGVKFNSWLTFEDQVRSIVSSVSQRMGILRFVKRVFVDTSVLLRCYYCVFILPIFEYCSPVWGLLLNAIFSFSIARCIRWPGFAMITLSCRFVIAVMLLNCVMLYEDNSNSHRCLFSEVPSASVRVRHTRAAAAVHPFEFEVARCRTSQFARCVLPAQTRVLNDLPYTVFYTGTLDVFSQTLVASLSLFFQFFRGACACGVA